MHIYRCKYGHTFDMPKEVTCTASEYLGTKAWTYTAELCPTCDTQHIGFTPEASEAMSPHVDAA